MDTGIAHILLADDDPDDQEFFCSGLHQFYPHIKVAVFSDGGPLLSYLEICSVESFPSCILLDYRMSGISAPQVLMATGVGTRYNYIPKLVWSTSRREKEIEECLLLGAFRFVFKPATDSDLQEFVKSLHCLFQQRLTPSNNDQVNIP